MAIDTKNPASIPDAMKKIHDGMAQMKEGYDEFCQITGYREDGAVANSEEATPVPKNNDNDDAVIEDDDDGATAESRENIPQKKNVQGGKVIAESTHLPDRRLSEKNGGGRKEGQ